VSFTFEPLDNTDRGTLTCDFAVKAPGKLHCTEEEKEDWIRNLPYLYIGDPAYRLFVLNKQQEELYSQITAIENDVEVSRSRKRISKALNEKIFKIQSSLHDLDNLKFFLQSISPNNHTINNYTKG
jgi:hypothetical protein